MANIELINTHFPNSNAKSKLREIFLRTNADREFTYSEYDGFTRWLNGKRTDLPSSIRDRVQTFVDDVVRPALPAGPVARDDPDEDEDELDDEQIGVLAQRLEELRIDSESYVYVYYDIRFACFDVGPPTRAEFAKGVIYIGKGVGDRYLHKTSAQSDIDDKLVAVRDGLPKANGRYIWTVKFPFTGLSDDQAKFIEHKLISYICSIGKHLWSDGCCNGTTKTKKWGKKCLANRYNGNRRVSLSENDHFSTMTAENLFDEVVAFFHRRVFMMM